MSAPPTGDVELPSDLIPARFTVTLVPGDGSWNSPRLTVSGFIDACSSDRFAEAVRAATARRTVILDLTDAQFLSSAAIDALFQCRSGLEAVVVGADSIVARALSMAGFPTVPARGPGRSAPREGR